MTDFDVMAAITEFLADRSRITLELPPMSTAGRKKAKEIVDRHPELRCESFGFGAERQLHVFKTEAGARTEISALGCQGTNVHEGSPSSSNASSRSHNLDKEVESAESQTFANVRNTFIHFESVSMDERTVQSMPHGMFGKFMTAEISQKHSMDNKLGIEESNVDLGEKQLAFTAGALVVVEGLVKAPTFNGLTAVVQGWDEASERYRILIGSIDGSSGSQQAMVKEENLKFVLPCP